MNLGSVLITGGTGFFGKAFVRHLLENNLSDRICIYSRDEYKQFQMRNEFGDDQRCRWFIGDVRDRDRLYLAMLDVDCVIHAAALKRIEVGHRNPTEMIKTNVIGSMNVVEASHLAGVKRVVYLSTDKAYQPISPYGQSKALGESLFLSANDVYGEHGPRFTVTRYGNISGSTGSIIPVWRSLGETVPVTDPACTRFWMEPHEAVDLVLKALIDTSDQRLFIPQLPAFRVGELAIAMNKRIDVIGLPAHEKRHESMEDGNSSDKARRMSIRELEERLLYV